jgi:hypothetical protein
VSTRLNYHARMGRVGIAQADLFAAPAPRPTLSGPELSPAEELRATLARLRGAVELPWPNLTEAMAAEHRVIGLGRLAGAEGAALVSEIMEQTERLLSAQERCAVAPI